MMSKQHAASKSYLKAQKQKRADAPPIPLPQRLPAQLKQLADPGLLNKLGQRTSTPYGNKSDTFFISQDAGDFKLTSSDRLQFSNFQQYCDMKMKILVLRELISKENLRAQKLEAAVMMLIKQMQKFAQEQLATKGNISSAGFEETL